MSDAPARFAGRCVVVTGASSGIGLASAQRLAAEGARVVLVARDPARLGGAKASLVGSGHVIAACDCRDAAALTALAQRLREDVQSVDALVLCAGVHALRPFQVLKEQHLDEALRGNLYATLFPIKAFLGLFPATGGAIVGVTSVAAVRGGAGVVAYAAAKGAVTSALRSLAVELAGRRVRVNWISAGVVRTPMSDGFLAKVGPEAAEEIRRAHLLGLGEPEYVAAAAAFLASDDARWVTGAEFAIDGGLSCH